MKVKRKQQMKIGLKDLEGALLPIKVRTEEKGKAEKYKKAVVWSIFAHTLKNTISFPMKTNTKQIPWDLKCVHVNPRSVRPRGSQLSRLQM